MAVKTIVEIKRFLWCYNKEDNEDKIWGYAKVGEKLYRFWGKRGSDQDNHKDIKFKREKILEDDYRCQLGSIAQQKLRKGYVEYTLDIENESYIQIEAIYPGFVNHMRNELTMAKLSGTIMSEN